MKHLNLPLLLVLLAPLAPVSSARAAIDVNVLEGSSWYFHVDFQNMRETQAGKGMGAWIEKEVFDEIEEELEIDLRGKLRRMTAFGEKEDDAVLDLEGRFSGADLKKLRSLLTDKSATKKHQGRTYYQADKEAFETSNGKIQIDTDSEWYTTFAFENRVVMTQSEKRMQQILSSGGKLPIKGGGKAIFVLSTEKRLFQAGADAEQLRKLDKDDDWDSNILKNTKKVGVMIADQDGKLAIDMRLQAKERSMAESIRNIVLGFIGLSAFNSDLDPALGELLRSVDVSLDGNVLRMRLAASPEAFLKALD
ncbi:MAG: hypothetical protein AAFQ82_01890 [Myxococcota bacterium]